MSLESYALVGGALRGGRIVTVSGIRGVGQLSGPGRVLLVPEFFWESVAVPVAKWIGVSSDQLATTFPYFNSFECTILVPVVALCWRGEPRLACGGSLDEFGLFKRVPASVRADAISNWFALRGAHFNFNRIVAVQCSDLGHLNRPVPCWTTCLTAEL